MKKKLGSLLLVICMCVVSLFPQMTVFARAEEATVLTLRIGEQIYENVTNGSVIVGDFDLKNLEFWVVSVNGNALENVGNKSGAQDSQGRNPLEVATIEADGRITVTLTYHAEDDPVAANQAYGFAVAGITFANSEENLSTVPTVSKISGVKATAKSKALKLTWTKKSVSGYEIQYSTSKTFKSAKTAKVSKSSTSYTIKNLKGSKTYYVRIRGYKTYTDDLGNILKAYGKWTTVSKKTKA